MIDTRHLLLCNSDVAGATEEYIQGSAGHSDFLN